MADPLGLIRQDIQIRNSLVYSDSIQLADLIPSAVADKNLQHDLNAIRSQIARIMGTTWSAESFVADQAFVVAMIGV